MSAAEVLGEAAGEFILRREVRQIFQEMGISGPTLDAVVQQVVSDKDQWVQLMMQEELGFSSEPPRPFLASMVMGLAFAIAAFFPVAPFVFIEGNTGLAVSAGLTAAALFGMGAWRAYLTGGGTLRKASEMVGLAAAAVVAANLIGRLVDQGIF